MYNVRSSSFSFLNSVKACPSSSVGSWYTVCFLTCFDSTLNHSDYSRIYFFLRRFNGGSLVQLWDVPSIFHLLMIYNLCFIGLFVSLLLACLCQVRLLHLFM
uniref:Uncharacterized protein n=1 Tax=Cacopsylla melanoneura TaxID=428564 RepID=A0A8D8RQ56_9HEMI